LKPFGLADFAESAVLQDACGSTLQLRALRLASSANSTIAQFRLSQEIRPKLSVSKSETLAYMMRGQEE